MIFVKYYKWYRVQQTAYLKWLLKNAMKKTEQMNFRKFQAQAFFCESFNNCAVR